MSRNKSNVHLLTEHLRANRNNLRLNNRTADLSVQEVLNEARSNGLRVKDMELIITALSAVNIKTLTVAFGQKLINCLIPVGNPSEKSVNEFLLWLLSNVLELQISTLKTGFIWLIGLLEYDMIEPKSIAWAYEKVFYALRREGLEAPVFRLLYLMTLSEHITRFRVKKLLKMRQKTKNTHVLRLLGLYKTLRPDMIPEPVPIVFEQTIAGENDIMQAFAKTKARIEALENGPHGEIDHLLNPKRIKMVWGSQRQGRRTRNKGALIPPMDFMFHQPAKQNNIFAPQRHIVNNKNLHELGLYILSSESPNQVLSLLVSYGGKWFLQFADEEVQQRLTFTLHHCLRHALVETGAKHSKPEDMLELLVKLEEFQRLHMQGSAVVTRFVSQFLRHHGRDNILFPVVLKLMTRSIFGTYEELYASLFPQLLTLFCSSDLENKELILNSVGSLILNMYWSAQDDDISEEKADSLVVILRKSCNFYSKLCCMAIVSTNLNECLSVIANALHFYKMVMLLEVQSCKVKIWTTPPIPLLLACLLLAQSWLINSACDLFLQHKNKSYPAHRSHRAICSKQIEQLNKLASNYASHLFTFEHLENSNLCSPRSNLFHNIPEKTLKEVKQLCDKKACLGLELHLSIAPVHMLMLYKVNKLLAYEEVLIFCKKNLPQLHEFILSFTETV